MTKLETVLMVTDDHSAVSGGVAAVVDRLSGKLAATGISVEILCVRQDPIPPRPGVQITQFPPSRLARKWGWSRALESAINAKVSRHRGTVVHLHGVWTASQWIAARAAARVGVPFVLSTHAMLQPWFWHEQGWKMWLKKTVYWRLVAEPAFRRATALHAITSDERSVLSSLLPGPRIVEIPNAVDTEDLESSAVSAVSRPDRIVLFMGRLHPQKGIDLLVHAFEHARIADDWRLVIAGPDGLPSYTKALRRSAHKSTRRDRIEFVGAIFGSAKVDLLRRAWILAAPSRSEVIGLVNLEAAGSGTPTITTRETGLHDWDSWGGMLIEPERGSMQKALEAACAWSPQERIERGASMRKLVHARYSWISVTPRWLELYESLIQ
jgi:glycosyltransferase involved in cell wall biosynthesis